MSTYCTLKSCNSGVEIKSDFNVTVVNNSRVVTLAYG
ncbi:hypothetical protein Hmuk_3180 [Halomicrobium mukohataei DSM 12286]|uniref:Uncharacterized protein n=1 Tax=Halomicrobium mukohataei (strain ATCC 700874 / DSM 12286 / JCM 9738 / NCIMB 13541) TaxID=485914 RepID=C7P2H0_HALMD|nr:hypothetical protein Hmuk_3180 [Halomicrobium mukohataei DSM 12286]